MGPTSVFVAAGLVVLAALLIAAACWTKRIWQKVVSGLLALIVAMSCGVVFVNDYYGYYTSWASAWADLSGSGGDYAVQVAAKELTKSGSADGSLAQVSLAGAHSGIRRAGLVYLPPQYSEPQYAADRFPVVELLHGTPGDPAGWVTGLDVVKIMNRLLQRHLVGPMVLVMPDSNGGLRHQEECLNTPRFKDDTYISTDVPTDMRAHYRVSDEASQLGMIGFSSGGYCAANLMLRHRSLFGSAAILSGYFTPTDGEAAGVLGYNRAAMAGNDPQATAGALQPGVAPLPALWLATGTANRDDNTVAHRFAHTMRRLESVPLLVVRGGHHTPSTARESLPAALVWTWQQLSAPGLRVQFPTESASLDGLEKASWLAVPPRTLAWN